MNKCRPPCGRRVLFETARKVKVKARVPVLLTVLSAALLTACSSSQSGNTLLTGLDIPIFGDSEEDLSDTVESLEVPPDLDEPDTRKDFRVAQRVQSAKRVRGNYVLPDNLQLTIHREGGVAWLSANADPVSLWPEIERFWRDLGFRFDESNPRHGYLVTNWRARAAGSALRDRYLTRLEREPDGRTNIYVANRIGRAEVIQGMRDQALMSDTEAELAVLQDLQDYLASSDLIVRAQIEPQIDERVALRLTNLRGVSLLKIEQSYSKVWRRLAVVLPRIGMTIRSSDRARGIYVIDVGRHKSQTLPEDGAQSASKPLLQLHLLAKGRDTVLTVHPHYREQRVDYNISQGILQSIVNGYYVDERKII